MTDMMISTAMMASDVFSGVLTLEHALSEPQYWSSTVQYGTTHLSDVDRIKSPS